MSAGEDAVALLLGLPRDKALRNLGGAELHGPRAFLSALLVSAQPTAVLGEEHASDAGRALTNASRMLTLSVQRLVDAMTALVDNSGDAHNRMRAAAKAGGGALWQFRAQLVMVRWARRYHAAAFFAWRKVDSEKVAAQLIGPYASCLGAALEAQQRGDAELEAAAIQRLGQLRNAIQELLGKDVASGKLQEVEAAVQQQAMNAAAYVNQTRAESRSSSANSTAQSSSLPRNQPQTQSGAASGAAAAEQPSSGSSSSAGVSLQDALVNEKLAHELVLDPNFQLPAVDDPPLFRPPADWTTPPTDQPNPQSLSPQELAGQMKSVMQRVFWQRLVTSLTPTAQQGAEDFKVGSDVQARWGGPQGSFYPAVVLATHEDGTFDVRYKQDGVEEQRKPLSDFRLASDPVDARPLLGLIDEVRKRLEGITPRRADLKAQYREVLDAPLLRQMLVKGALDGGLVLRLFQFVLDTIERLEAPARAERTRAWKQALEAHLAGSTSPVALVQLLPNFFSFVFAALDQLERDLGNTQLAMLAPQLRGEKGQEFERTRFDAKLERKLTALTVTSTWLNKYAQPWCAQDGAEAYANRRAALAGGIDRAAIRECVGSAVLSLVQLPMRLDSPEAAAQLPETLAWDGGRLAKVRDMMDRIVLVATLVTILRQVLAQHRVVPSKELLQELQTKLDWMLQQPDTRLPALQQAVQESATAATASSPSITTSTLDTMQSTLANLVSSAAHPSNSIFALFQRRSDQLLHDLALASSGSVGAAAAADSARIEAVLDTALPPTGLAAFRPLLLEAGRLMHRLIDHNTATFHKYYSDILGQAAQKLPVTMIASE